MMNLWRNYRHRFVPWLAFNLQSRTTREIAVAGDKVVCDKDLEGTVLHMMSLYHLRLKNSPFFDGKAAMQDGLGYSVTLFQSRLKGGGTGGVLSSGRTKEGDVVALYPGTLYRRFEPILLPSIGNRFVLRCMDGIYIDGSNKFLSKAIYRSCVLRDSSTFQQYTAADLSWVSQNPAVPWNIGQYVNNCTATNPANVVYQELDLINFPPELDYLLPNIWYSGKTERHLRIVVLVASQTIEQGDELLSNYMTILHNSK